MINQALEGLLFLSGEKGITTGELILLLNKSENEIKDLLAQLNDHYQKENHAFCIIESAGTYKLCTTKDNYEIYQNYAQREFNDRLSPSALETLAIIAYNQPITRFSVEEMRGVNTSHHFKTLLNRDLIKVVGKSEEIGKPNLYGTTNEFLDFLGINSLEELPPLSQFSIDEANLKADLFSEEEDYKEIRNRLLRDDNLIKPIEEEDFSQIDEIEVKDIQLISEDMMDQEEVSHIDE